jgi:hypothetical protein
LATRALTCLWNGKEVVLDQDGVTVIAVLVAELIDRTVRAFIVTGNTWSTMWIERRAWVVKRGTYIDIDCLAVRIARWSDTAYWHMHRDTEHDGDRNSGAIRRKKETT